MKILGVVGLAATAFGAVASGEHVLAAIESVFVDGASDLLAEGRRSSESAREYRPRLLVSNDRLI